MRFLDPFAVLQYLGGAISIHLALLLYSGYIIFYLAKDLECFDDAKFVKKETMFRDVSAMFVAHIVCIVCAIVRKFFPTKTTAGQFWRNVLNHGKIWTYLLSLMYVTMSAAQQDLRPTQKQSEKHNCPGVAEK